MEIGITIMSMGIIVAAFVAVGVVLIGRGMEDYRSHNK